MILILKHNSKRYLSIGINKQDDTGIIQFVLIPYLTKSKWVSSEYGSIRIKEVYFLLFYFAIYTNK